MDCRIQGCSPTFIPVVYIDSPLQKVESCLDGSAYPFLMREQLFARVRIVCDVLSFDEQVDCAEIANVDVDWMGVCVFDEEIDLAFVEQVESCFVMVCGVFVGVHVVLVGLDEAFEFAFD